MTGTGHYRALLGLPHVPALVGWSLLGRLPLGMAPLALLLLVRGEGGSYGAAGVVVAVYAVAVGVGAPIGGRQVDRTGPTPSFAFAPSCTRCRRDRGRACRAGAGLVAIGAVAALAGLSLPPLSSAVRIVWPRLAPDDLRSTAYALEATLQEIFFVGGPLLAAALAAVTRRRPSPEPVSRASWVQRPRRSCLRCARPLRRVAVGRGLLGRSGRWASARWSSTPRRSVPVSGRSSSRCPRSPRRTAPANSEASRSPASPQAASSVAS